MFVIIYNCPNYQKQHVATYVDSPDWDLTLNLSVENVSLCICPKKSEAVFDLLSSSTSASKTHKHSKMFLYI